MFELNSPEHKAYAWGCEEGEQAERKRIIALLNESFPAGWDYAEKDPIVSVITLIKEDAQRRVLDELQRLAEETGEHENFDNPLIDGETK